MCKYCSKSELEKMRATFDAMTAPDADYDEDAAMALFEEHAIMEQPTWLGCTFYFLDGTKFDEDSFAKWDNSNFAYCPVCGAKIER